MKISSSNSLAEPLKSTRSKLEETAFAANLQQIQTALPPLQLPDWQQAKADFAAQMPALLRKYGLSAPPSLQIMAAPQGLTLAADDPRGSSFDHMLRQEPGAQQMLAKLHSAMSLQRSAASAGAADIFVKTAKDSARAQAVLNQYTQQPVPNLAIAYDGLHVEAQEQVGELWRPLKTQDEFLTELFDAYQSWEVDPEAGVDALLQMLTSSRAAKASSPSDAPTSNIGAEDRNSGHL